MVRSRDRAKLSLLVLAIQQIATLESRLLLYSIHQARIRVKSEVSLRPRWKGLSASMF